MKRTGDRFAGIPGWLLASQVFLAVGWLRAAVAHGVAAAWWDGSEIVDFAAEQRDQAVPLYRPFLDGPVTHNAVAVGVVVLVLEVVVGVMLLTNTRPLRALAIGAWLNLHFMLAGAVNPSIFYLLIAAAIVLARVEEGVANLKPTRLARVALISAVVTVAALSPFVSTMDPEKAVEDPALTLIFLSLLTAAGAWAVNVRATAQTDRTGRSSQIHTAIEAGAADDLIALFGGPTETLSAATSHGPGGNGATATAWPNAAHSAVDRPATEPVAGPDHTRDAMARHRWTSTDAEILYTSDQVLAVVEQRTGHRFNRELHDIVADKLGIRSGAGEAPRTIDPLFARCRDMTDPYLYSDDWVELLCHALGTSGGFTALTGREPSTTNASGSPTG